jgi:hypothetical protein
MRVQRCATQRCCCPSCWQEHAVHPAEKYECACIGLRGCRRGIGEHLRLLAVARQQPQLEWLSKAVAPGAHALAARVCIADCSILLVHLSRWPLLWLPLCTANVLRSHDRRERCQGTGHPAARLTWHVPTHSDGAYSISTAMMRKSHLNSHKRGEWDAFLRARKQTAACCSLDLLDCCRMS